MPYWRFQIANFVSALLWSAVLLLCGDVISLVAQWIWQKV
jgi:membrane protein DedA with SNARE-associated domain